MTEKSWNAEAADGVEHHDLEYRGRDLPWPGIVRFHKEIASRAEENFFSLPTDEQSDRWTSLVDFEPEQLSGPWSIPRDALRSRNFQLALEQRSHDTVFIGGACYVGSERVDGTYQTRWRPLVYREIEVEIVDDELRLTPRQAHWQLSPLVFSLIDRLQIRPEGIDRLADDVIEKAVAIGQAMELGFTDAITRALISLVPEVEQEVTRAPLRSDFRVKPSRWVLFAPANKYSALTRYLMRDYERLEEFLAEDPANLGGLRLFEDRSPPGHAEGEALPVVPLNDSQRTAVRAALGDRPLTVISGPPGCGKSQVVVSMLLNCWASGRPVLFASNNNKAVDVVKERLERFESEFPIAVRAGSKRYNNVVDVLRRTLNMASAAVAGSTSSAQAATRTRRQGLLKQRADLVQQLDTRLPQRIDETLRTALTAYSASRAKVSELETLSSGLGQRLAALKLGDLAGAEVGRSLVATRQWLARVSDYKAMVDADEAQRRATEAQRPVEFQRLADALSRTGWSGDPAAAGRWLLNGPSPDVLTQWDARARAIFERSIDADLEPLSWLKEFEEWLSQEEAESWSAAARTLATDIRSTCGEMAPVIERLEALRLERDQARASAAEFGVPEDPDLPREALTLWATYWSEACSLPSRRLDILPWTRRSKLERELKLVEQTLRRGLPIAIWARIGRLDDSGRAKLADVVEGCRAWLDARERWQQAREDRESTERRFEALRTAAARLHVSPVPTIADTEAWRKVAGFLEGRARDASLAAEAWARRKTRERTQADVRRLATDWVAAANGSPLKEAWRESQGVEFDRGLRMLLDQQTVETLQWARTVYYATSLTGLIEPWQDAAAAQTELDALQRELAQIPAASARVRAWASERPEKAVLEPWLSFDWPDQGADQRWHLRLEEVGCWCDEWERFVEQVQPKLQGEAERELNWAKESLLKAASLLPGEPEYDRLRTLVRETAAKNERWTTAELTEAFRQFGPEMLKARIDGIDAELERSAFADAKSNWLSRLAGDAASIRAVDALEKAMSRNRGDLPVDRSDAFKAALRLVPVWITTAQAPQAIPLEPGLFDLVIIDEASQCTLTNLLPLVYRAKRLVVIGDEQQLPAIPTIQESEEQLLARKHRIEEHLDLVGHVHNDVFKAAAASLPRQRGDVTMLVEHFRSHPLIIGFSNRNMYNKRLEIKRDPNAGRQVPFGSGVHRIQVRGQASRRGRGGSWLNIEEGKVVLDQIQRVKQSAPHLSIGVVTPFAAQKEWLRDQVDGRGLASEVLVDTAYGFQGDERDVMFFSAVVARGITPGASQWVEQPPNLINVALTRAREALFVVADFDFCMQQNGVLRALAEYCRDVQLLRDTSAAELSLYSWMIVEGLTPAVHPRIGDHEVDFTLRSDAGIQVAVEIDGTEHHEARTARDSGIDAYLEGRGFRVVRVSGRAAIETPHDVIHRIQEAMA